MSAPFRLGYNTNGLPFHRLEEALVLVEEAGFEAVAITPDVGALDPMSPNAGEVEGTRALLDDLGLEATIETGARFLLDPRAKHRPNLMDDAAAARERRVDFYRRCIDLAADLDARVVSLWAGAAPEGTDGTLDDRPDHPLVDRLAEGLDSVLRHARGAGVRIAFEPEPGMFVERPAGFEALVGRMGHAGQDLGMTLDLGHCAVTSDLPVRSVVDRFADRLIHVHVADCPAGVHQHLPLGEGDLDLAEALGALVDVGFDGVAAVELSRDGHRAPDALAASFEALTRALTSAR
ncbi:MAG: sugar phosphate isomerase/epimerase family protein [Planctomycetota bacterium]|nr:sugar phosphate isomerase/epimerase family protein [Planctomycetota bacterium]